MSPEADVIEGELVTIDDRSLPPSGLFGTDDPELVSVRIGSENPVTGLQSTSLVSMGYGSGSERVASLGVLGPTRMDYPTTMASVRAVARYVSEILDENQAT